MSLKDDLLRTTQAKLEQQAQAQMPKSWRASERRNEDGSVDITSRPYSDDVEAEETQLLRDHGYDPDRYMIVGGWRTSSWTAYRPEAYRKNSDPDDEDDLSGFTFTARAYKFKVQERPRGTSREDIDSLVSMIEGMDSTPRPVTPHWSGALIHAIGDTQVGKLENPTEGVAQRFIDHANEVQRRLIMLDAEGFRVNHMHLALLGDCIEGDQSQGGSLRWRTTLTMTEQVRVVTRLIMYAVKAYAPWCNRLTVASVPGNHDSGNKRDLQTRMDDSWAVQALVQVEDAIAFTERGDLKHVECYVPGVDQQGVTLDVAGLRVAHIHGHQHRAGKHFDWWRGQAFGGQDEGTAGLLLEGHLHHWHMEEDGNRLFIGAPAMEAESVWWKHAKGTPGNPGSLLIEVQDGAVGSIERLSAKGAA